MLQPLLDKLASHQVTKDDRYYRRGMFPAQRVHPYLPYAREDSNIFYSALIAFTLSPLLPWLNAREKVIVEKILAGVRENFPAYESQRAPGLYNFYRTRPPDPYPNGRVLRHFKHFRLAEDADDTVLVSMSLPALSAARLAWLREELVRFSNLGGQRLRHLLPAYDHIPAHGVWLGTGAMPVEVDVCVLCNILTFTAQQGCAFNATDAASLAFIRQALLSGDWRREPFALSYYYPDPTVILYHIARLWAALPDPSRHLPAAPLRLALEERLAEVSGALIPELMLSTALLKVDRPVRPLSYTLNALENAASEYPFFVAPLLAGTRSRRITRLAAQRFLQLDYRCASWFLALALEYEVLYRRGEK